jgi:tripartite-type tricarboxylate transporter receptor subunit TctC
MQPRLAIPLSATFALAMSGAALAQQPAEAYPSKPVVIVIPFAAGTSIDQAFRLYAQSIQESTGKQFIMNYQVGAAGSIGAAAAAKAKPDGYTLLAATSAIVITPFTYANLTYDHIRDFAPITLMLKQLYVLAAHPSVPFKDTREYIAYARANPEKINYATAGAGSSTHLPGALLHYMTDTRVTFIHYKAATQRMLDLTAGRVDVTGATLTAALPHLKSGKLRSLGIASAQRTALYPEMPTIAEQGVPGYEYTGWNGLAAPAGTPTAIINRLHTMFVAAGKDPNVITKLEATGTVMVNSTPQEFRQHIAVETERWRKVIKASGIKLEE